MVNLAFRVCTDTSDFALLTAFGDDGFRCELASLVLRPALLPFLGRLFLPDFNVAIPRNCGASLLLRAVGSADLNQLGFCSDCLAYMRLDLRRVALRIRALCGIWANCKSFLLARRRRVDRVRP